MLKFCQNLDEHKHLETLFEACVRDPAFRWQNNSKKKALFARLAMEELRVNPTPYQNKGLKDIVKLLEKKFPYNLKPINRKIKYLMTKLLGQEQNRQLAAAQGDQVISFSFFPPYRGCQHGSMKLIFFVLRAVALLRTSNLLQNSG